MSNSKLDVEQMKRLEDEVRERLELLSPLAQAIAYLYLNASGVTLEKARDLRRKATL